MTYIAGNDDDNNHELALHNQYQTMWQRAVAFWPEIRGWEDLQLSYVWQVDLGMRI